MRLLSFEEGVFSNKPFLQFLLQLNIFLAGVVVKLGRRLYQQSAVATLKICSLVQ